MKILVFGNRFEESDSLALQVAKQLEGKFDFEYCESAEGIEKFGKNLTILDCAKGISRVQWIESLDELKLPPRATTHDFDLAFQLKLLQKVGLIDTVKMLAVPFDYPLEKAIQEAEALLIRCLKK
ncbi:MAG: hypothetical protein V1847_03885 [Candidatus Diapherotrites archaeon]